MPGSTAFLGDTQARLGAIRLGEGAAAVAAPATFSATLPALSIEFSPSTGATGGAVWVDLTSSVISFTCSRGRNHEMDRVETGTCSMVLANDDRRFDPTNTAGPYYGQLVPYRRIRIRATWAGVTYPVWAGYVDEWNPPLWSYDRLVTPVACVDGLALLAQKKISGPFVQQTTGQRIDAVINATEWSTGQAWRLQDATYGVLGTSTFLGPVGDRSISTGKTTVQAQELSNVSALAHIQLMATTENGLFYGGADGSLVFKGRWERLYPQATVATFGTDVTLGEAPFADADIDATGGDIWNDVKVTRIGGDEQAVEDAISQAAYFGRTYSLTGLPLTNDTEALAYANWVLMAHKDFHVRLNQLVLDPPGVPTTLWPLAFGIDLTDKLRVVYRPAIPAGAAAMDEAVQVERVQHAYSAIHAAWATTFQLSPARGVGSGGAGNYGWVLGQSILATDTRPVY